MNIDVLTLFPGWFEWFRSQRHVTNALERGHELSFVDLRATTPLKSGQVDDTPYGGGAGMVIRVDVVEAALGIATTSTRSSCAAGGGLWRSLQAGGSSTRGWPRSWRRSRR